MRHTTTEPARVLIVDDHPVVRQGLSLLISAQPDLELAGEADTPRDALRLFDELQPDLMILDLTLKDGHGLDVLKQLKARHPQARVLVSSIHDDDLYAERSLSAGAMGYVNKREDTGRLLDAIRQVLDGKFVLSGPVSERLRRRDQDPATTVQAPEAALTNRELEVFELLGRGLTSPEIATRLGIRQKTVETFRERIKGKLELANSNQLIQHAVQWVLEQR